jgi:hypothetical protein
MKYTLLLLLAIMTNLVIKTATEPFYCIFVTMKERIDLHFNGEDFLLMRNNPPVGASFSETKKPGPNISATRLSTGDPWLSVPSSRIG